jgi:hypothetical protein
MNNMAHNLGLNTVQVHKVDNGYLGKCGFELMLFRATVVILILLLPFYAVTSKE